MLYYICAKAPGAYDTVNIRENPSVKAKVVGQVSTRGMLAEDAPGNHSGWYEGAIWWQYRLASGITGWIAESVHKAYRLLQFGRDSAILPVPHRWQHDPVNAKNHPNDCGPAALSSVMLYYSIDRTVDQVSKVAGLVGREFAHFSDLISAAKYFGLKDAYHMRPCHIPDILASLDDNRPVLALVNYDLLQPGRKYGHFVVIAGYILRGDKMLMYIVDPNLKESVTVYPVEQVAAALAEGQKVGNMPYQAMLFKTPPEKNYDPVNVMDTINQWSEDALTALGASPKSDAAPSP